MGPGPPRTPATIGPTSGSPTSHSRAPFCLANEPQLGPPLARNRAVGVPLGGSPRRRRTRASARRRRPPARGPRRGPGRTGRGGGRRPARTSGAAWRRAWPAAAPPRHLNVRAAPSLQRGQTSLRGRLLHGQLLAALGLGRRLGRGVDEHVLPQVRIVEVQVQRAARAVALHVDPVVLGVPHGLHGLVPRTGVVVAVIPRQASREGQSKKATL